MTLFKFKSVSYKIAAIIIIIYFSPLKLEAQLFGPGFQTVIKTEYQYSDYFKYGYPDPILFDYPDAVFSQPQPYIAAFPEHRFLTRITQYFGFKTSLALRYQRGIVDNNTRQNIYNTKLTYEINDQYSVMGAYQYMNVYDSQVKDDILAGHMFEIGGKFNFAGFIHLEPSYSFYSSDYTASDAKSGGADSFTFKYRQALTNSTALQVKYNYFNVDYTTYSDENRVFSANTMTLWLSQYFPTETALHLSNRFYWNSAETNSFSPGIEAVQYITWDVILHLSYRYYKNKPKEEEFLQRIKGDSFSSNAVSAILDYSLSADSKLQLKYRYYTGDQNITMNTYLISLEQIF